MLVAGIKEYKMKRLAIYVHHNPQGLVGDYILYCIKGLQEVVNEILFVVNGSISSDGRKKLEELGVDILVRENKGFDWSGWKAGIEYYGYNKISQYDELLLTNNTYYGPIYPFSEMWKEMDKRDCDFWGINKHRETDFYWLPDNPNSKMLEHIQSYWLVFKKRILASKDFKNYWENVPVHQNFSEMVGLGETKLTDYFVSHGFKADTYMNFEKYDKLLAFDPCFMTKEQVIKDRCPIAKRKYFHGIDYNNYETQHFCNDGPKELLNFLDNTKVYDTALIWKDLLANNLLSDINRRLHLNYILSSTLKPHKQSDKKVAVIMYIYPIDLIEYCFEYAQNIPDWIDIVIVNTDEKVQQKCKEVFAQLSNKVDFRLQENRGRDNTALLVTCKDIIKEYDYLCFVHSKKSPYFSNQITGEFFRDHNFKSLLFSKNYIENIVHTFINNPFLGILSPLIPNTSVLQSIMLDRWSVNYKNTEDFLTNKMHVKITLDKDIMGPFGGMFWCRTKALKTLSSYPWNFNDFPKEPLSKSDGLLTHTIERSFSLLAQYDGFYTAWTAPDCYAEVYLNNMFNKYINAISQIPIQYHSQQISQVTNMDILSNIANYSQNRFNYYRCKLLANLTFGKMRKHYKNKKKKLKAKIKEVRRLLKEK